jgi:DNA gyrase subunit A
MTEVQNVFLEDELQRSYIDYAMSVIIGRAIPDARDGLKPVQRRILYTMYGQKNFHNLPTKKSARITGDCMGRYHPHGDMAIYDALARMTQDFSMRYMLAEGQGNFGSIDGDPPAAMRYTEVRLTKVSEDLLEDLDKETVNFVPNFDNTEKEPTILPSRIPNLLVNGATGIAVGVATSIPPHNLGEVCEAVIYRIKNKESTPEDILKIIKGPDFPTGGIAVMSANALNGYKYGRGQISVKAKAEIDDELHKIIITEIPYNLNKSSLIEGIVNTVKDKKTEDIKDIRDETDKSGIRIVIDLKSGASGESVLNTLYKHTQLQTTMPIINLAVIDTALKNLNIVDMLDAFINHRREVILRRSKYEREVAANRLHIVEGLLIAITNIDDVIKLIKSSDEVSGAKKKLIKDYALSEKQATAILDMKLSRLTHLENNSLDKEKTELQGKVKYYNEVIESSEKVDGIIIQETEKAIKDYSDKRRTEIIYSDESADITEEDMITDEEITVIRTKAGYVKRLSKENYREQARGGKGIISINLKDGDYVNQILRCNNKDFILCITSTGRAYWLKAYKIPETGRYSEGKSIVNLIHAEEEKIVSMIPIRNFEGSTMAFITARGTAKRMSARLFAKPRSNGVRAITLSEGDEIVDSICYSGKKYLLISTKKGKIIKFEEQNMRTIGRTGMGVRGIKLRQDDRVTNIIAASEFGSVFTVTEKGYGKITEITKYRTQNRGGKGIINLKVSEKTGDVSKTLYMSHEQQAILINSKGVSITIPTSSIRITGRAASGVRLMKAEQGTKIIDCIILNEEQPKPAEA